MIRKDGSPWWGLFAPTRISGSGITSECVEFIVDITARKRLEEQIRQMAFHDPLTGLPNRRLFLDIANLQLLQARREGRKVAVLFVDLDRFKAINDELGHAVGDELLVKVAERLRATVRASDTVARIGGDEFNTVLPDLSRPDDAAELARKIIGAFRQPFRAGGHELQVTTSIGIAVYPDDSEDAGSLLRLADMALYHAKERGRNTFSFYNPVIDTRSTERTRLEAVLRRALERNEFRLYFQPLVSASTGRIVSSEVLLRWQHPERGLLEPGDFFSSAEHIGFLPDIDEWVLRTACRQIRQWLDQGISPPDVTVNLSGVYFQRNVDLPDRVARILEEARLPPEYLNIEISEKVAMDDIERTAARLDGLVEKGVHVSVDGFGAGCSSVKYLNRLPISRLKMDRAFVRDLGADSSDPAIIRAVVLMAHTMNKKVVGEGVETEGQLRFLRMVDCDEVQGYLFSRPVPAEQFRDQMTAGRP